MKEYGHLMQTHERPYIIRTTNLVVFGAEHIKDPQHPQNQTIEIEFNKFNPTVVLVEGRLGFYIPFFMDPIKNFGEMGKVAALAKKRKLAIYSWEPPKSELLNSLIKNFDPEQLALKEILNPYFSNVRYGIMESPENFVKSFLHRAEWLGVQHKINSIGDIDRIWKRDFSNEKDWRDTNDQWGLPGYLAEISDAANMIRNQHLLCSIEKLSNQGERIFVVCGSSHAVCIHSEIKEQG